MSNRLITTSAIVNNRLTAGRILARLVREQEARNAGQPSPLLDRIESVSLIDANATTFIAECDSIGIVSQADDSQRA